MNIHRRIVEFIDSGRSFAVALVLKAEGSTPRDAGVRAIVDETGRIWGTLGGGVVEAQAQTRAVEACGSGHAVVFDVRLDSPNAREHDPICGGAMRLVADPAAAVSRDHYARAAEALARRQRGVLLTTVRVCGQAQVEVQWLPEEVATGDAQPGPELPFPGAEAIAECLARETAQLFVQSAEEGEAPVEVLVEPVIPRPLLLIVGGGHIGQALTRQAVLIGFDVTVIDDRPEFADPSRFPEEVSTRCGDVARELAAAPIADDTYIVVVTPEHKQDAEALAACIRRPAAYIGMIGSKRKVALIRQNFLESGLATQDEFSRVFAPIGLDIGAVTVPEIAMSIAAQLVAVRRQGSAYTPPADMTLP